MDGMSREWAEKIRNAGNHLPNIAALYADHQVQTDSPEVEVKTNLAYGVNERHVLDLYVPKKSQSLVPVVIFLHGGGFIRGNKEHRQNIGYFLAQQGIAVAMPNYRLAPEFQWPSGAEDVAKVWSWTQHHAQHYALDINHVFLMGESAGAAHVASLALLKKHQPDNFNIAGAILLSGPYHPELEHLAYRQLVIDLPDIRNEAYFGHDPQQWSQTSIINLIDQAPFPLLISYTALDLPQMQVQACELFSRLVCQHGYDPELLIIPDHNHFSQGYSFGTEDLSVSRPIMEFLNRYQNR